MAKKQVAAVEFSVAEEAKQYGQKSESQVEEQCHRLSRMVEILPKAVDALESRLYPVLRTSDTGQNGSDGVELSLVPHAEYLRRQVNQMVALNDQLNDIIDRLEI